MKKKAVKYAFYYRTRDQFEAASMLLKEINDVIGYRRRSSLFDPQPAVINSSAWNIDAIRKHMPKSIPSKKKYIATFLIQALEHSRIPFDIEKRLVELGLVMVSKAPNKPKHSNDDLTFGAITFRTVDHFKKVSSMLNDKYGHGNWHYRGSRKIIQKLKHIEQFHRNGFMFSTPTKKEQQMLASGVKVTIAVVGKVSNLEPLLFKAQLMG